MINTAPPASNSVYGREKLFWYDKINFQIMCVTVVQWSRSCLLLQINRVRLPVTLFSVSFYFFFFFSVWSLFLNTVFPSGLFFLYSYCWSRWSCTWINIYFKLKSGVLFWKRDFKSSWSAYWPSLRPEKNHKLSRHVPRLKQLIFFSMLVDVVTNNATHSTPQSVLIYTQHLPVVTHWRKLIAFCTSS